MTAGHIWPILNVIADRLTAERGRGVVENLPPWVLLKLNVSLNGVELLRCSPTVLLLIQLLVGRSQRGIVLVVDGRAHCGSVLLLLVDQLIAVHGFLGTPVDLNVVLGVIAGAGCVS